MYIERAAIAIKFQFANQIKLAFKCNIHNVLAYDEETCGYAKGNHVSDREGGERGRGT